MSRQRYKLKKKSKVPDIFVFNIGTPRKIFSHSDLTLVERTFCMHPEALKKDFFSFFYGVDRKTPQNPSLLNTKSGTEISSMSLEFSLIIR